MRDPIKLLVRQSENGHSIEELFDSIFPFLTSKSIIIKLPHSKLNIKTIVKNIIFSFRNRGFVTHITGDIHYVAIGTGRNSILTVHDVNSILRGKGLKRFVLKTLWFTIPAIIVKKITVISEFSKAELLKIIPFATNKIVVVHNPYNNRISFVEKEFNACNPQILHIGTKDNKNLDRVIKAISGLRCNIIIVGKMTTEQTRLLSENRISYVNKFNIAFDEIIKLYNECDIVSFPSLYEGFGMPILEGNKAGRAVLTSNICSMPEIAGNSACIVDPYSITDIRKGFVRIIEDETYRKRIINNGFINIESFAPEKIASKYNELYKSI